MKLSNVFLTVLLAIGIADSSSAGGSGRKGEFEPDENAVGLWHFNEGAGDVVYDFGP